MQLADWEEFDMAAITKETLDAFVAAIGKIFSKHTKKEIAEEGLKRGIGVSVVNNPVDVYETPQLRARNYWVDLGHPELGVTLAYPRHFFVCSETENYVRCRSPLIGEDNDKVYCKELGLSSTDIAVLKQANVI
jgi:crotonobetainyl-CoA:carnitine CoA-transferase CaiB-like acyl-CoA transferase